VNASTIRHPRKEPQIYAPLAAWARSHDYARVTRHVVQHWVKRGLLPRAERHRDGFGAAQITLPIATGRQLLALCRYRYDWEVGRLSMLQALLWLDGYSVQSAGIRANHRGVIGQGIAKRIGAKRADAAQVRQGWRPREQDLVTSALADWPPLADLLRRLPETDRIAVVEEIALLGGRGEPLSDFALTALDEAMGATLRRGRLKPTVRSLQASIPVGRTHLTDKELFAVRAAWPTARDAAMASLGVSEPGFAAWRDLAAFQVELFWLLATLDQLPPDIGAVLARSFGMTPSTI